jgi:hypothetical protein
VKEKNRAGGRRKRRESQRKTAAEGRETRKRQAMYVRRNIVTRWCNHCCHGNEAMHSVFIVEPHVVFHNKRNRRGRYKAASSSRPFLPYCSVLTHVLKIQNWPWPWPSRFWFIILATELNLQTQRTVFVVSRDRRDVTCSFVVLHCYTSCRSGNYTTLATIQPT